MALLVQKHGRQYKVIENLVEHGRQCRKISLKKLEKLSREYYEHAHKIQSKLWLRVLKKFPHRVKAKSSSFFDAKVLIL